MAKEILCTLGPASMNENIISRLEELGITLFRINLSHTPLDKVASSIKFVTSCTKVPFCLDSEGAQIRTGSFAFGEVQFQENSVVRAHLRHVPGDVKDFNFYPLDIISKFRVGDFISIDFNAVLVQVIQQTREFIVMRVINGGTVGSNKAVTVDRDIDLPPFTPKDQAAFRIGVEMGIKHFALSFANEGADVDATRSIVGNDAFVISKIECRNGLINLADIATKSDAILIDRGDLSRQIAIEQIPGYQKKIIREGKKYGCRVYVATNLLESMVTSPIPTRAEANDVYNTILDGADGLVLAAETAIGKYPVRCASMVVRIMNELERKEEINAQHSPIAPQSLLVAPNGGSLVQSGVNTADLEDIGKLPRITVDDSVLLDCERITNGTYSPLTGFLNSEELAAVLEKSTLPDGVAWPLPIVLPVSREAIKGIPQNGRIALTGQHGKIHALVDVRQVFPFAWEQLAKPWFGTTAADHPGVAKLKNSGDHFIAGRVIPIEGLPITQRHFELNPVQTRFIFTHKGWTQVMGFPTQDLAHRCNEELLLNALQDVGVDGLYINPLHNPVADDHSKFEAVLSSYQTLLEFGIFPQGRVTLGSLAIHKRYAGPREVLFRALCLQNMGCSHFLVTPGSNFSANSAAIADVERFWNGVDNVEIIPIIREDLGFHTASNSYQPLSKPGVEPPWTDLQIWSELSKKEPLLPAWFMRELVKDHLFHSIANKSK